MTKTWSALFAVAAVLCVFPAAAAAKGKVVTLKGQVVGQPYAAKGGKTAVQVMIDKSSAKPAGLRSRVGVLIIARKYVIQRYGQPRRIAARFIRLNDRINTRARVRPTVRRDSFWRIPTKNLTIVARSTTLSAAELQQLVEDLREDMDKLLSYTRSLASYTLVNIAALKSDIAALKADVAALKLRVSALEADLAALSSELDAVKAALEAKIAEVDGALREQLAALLARVTSLESALGLLTTRVTTLETSLATVQSTITTIQNNISDLTTTLSMVDLTAITALIGTVPGGSTLVGLIGDLQSDLLTVAGDLTALDTATDAALGGLDARLDTIEPVVASLDTSVTAITQELTTGAGIDGSRVDALAATLATAQTDITTALANAAAAQTTANNAATAAADAQADVDAVTSDVCGAGGLVARFNELRAVDLDGGGALPALGATVPAASC